jgi:DNA-binding response OmpR family regulator/DNA-binding SARP family transcriptional activator
MDIRILVVEDDQSMLQMVSELLEAEGYSVTGSQDGETALKLANDQTFDLVVTDIKLGKLDGLDTLSEMKKGNSTFQSLVMTGYSTEADTIRALKLGVGNYLKKPFSLDDFLVAVQEQVRIVVGERRTQARETAALKTLVWALKAVLHSREQEEGVWGADRAEQIARRAALALGLPARTVHATRAMTLLNCLNQSGGAPWDRETLSGFPQPVPQMLSSLQNDSFIDRSPETQLVSVAVAASTLDSDTEQPLEELNEQFPDLPESLSEAVAVACSEGEDPSASPLEARRSLLSLASALQATGDQKGAALALSRLGRQLSRESLTARLLQARMEWENGQAEQAVSGILDTVEQAGHLNSGARGQTSLDGGLLLLEMGDAQAAPLLKQAQEILDKEGSREEQARLRLGLFAAGEGVREEASDGLVELMQARHLESFLRCGPWLLPLLLRMEAEESSNEIVRASRRLIRDLQDLSNDLIRKGLPKESLVSALKGISSVGRAGYEKTLKWLQETSQEPDIRTAAERLLGQQSKEPLPPVLRVYLTGGFETWFGNKLLKWSGTKYQYLFAYICSSPSTVVPLEGLLDMFWPDHGRRAQRCFSQALSSMKRILQPPDWDNKLSYLGRSSDGVSVNPKLPVWSDTDEIRKALVEARVQEEKGQLKEMTAAVGRANRAYRGPFLAGCYMDWALQRRQSLIHDLNEATLKVAGKALDEQRNYDALADSEEVLNRDSLSEQAQGIKMQALARSGRSAEAVRTFEAFSRNLRHELNVEPSTELLRAYHLARMED